MANKVNIKVTSESKGARRDIGQIDKSVGKLKTSTTGMGKAFGGLNKGLAMAGVGAIGFGIVLKKLTSTSGEVRRSQASLELVLGGLPPSVRKMVDKITPGLKDLAKGWGFTEKDVAVAIGGMIIKTRDLQLTEQNLNAVLALAKHKKISVAQAADIMAEAHLGNIEPLKDLIGEFADMDDAERRIIKTSYEALTATDHMAAGFAQLLVEASKLWEGLMRGTLAAGKYIKKAWKETFDFSGLREAASADLQNWFGLRQPISTAVDFVTGTIPDFAGQVFEWIKKPAQVTLDFIKGTIPDFAGKVFEWASIGAEATLNFVTGTLPTKAREAFDTLVKGGRAMISIGTGAVTGMISDIFDWVNFGAFAAINFMEGRVSDFVRTIWNWSKRAAEATINFFDGSIPDFVKRIWDWTRRAARVSIDFVVRGGKEIFDKLTGAISTGVSFLTGGNPEDLQKGGIVTRPTLAMIGEAGAEAVIPLSKMGAMGGGGNIVVNVHNPVVDDEQRLASLVKTLRRELDELLRRGVGLTR